MRARDELKAALEKRATLNQRSLSEEAEAILESALQGQALWDQTMTFAFGRQLSGLITAMGHAAYTASIVARGSAANVTKQPRRDFELLSSNSFLFDPTMFLATSSVFCHIVNAIRPPGEVDPTLLGLTTEAEIEDIGKRQADYILSVIAIGESEDEVGWEPAVRAQLGQSMVDRIRAFVVARHRSQKSEGNSTDG